MSPDYECGGRRVMGADPLRLESSTEESTLGLSAHPRVKRVGAFCSRAGAVSTGTLEEFSLFKRLSGISVE